MPPLLEADLRIRLLERLHVGTGTARGGVHVSVTLDGNGRPVLPPSSFRGALRQAAEQAAALLEGVGVAPVGSLTARRRAGAVLDRPCRLPDPKQVCFGPTACAPCRLFGNGYLGRRLRVRGTGRLRWEGGAPLVPVESTPHVRIDRARVGAADTALYTSEAAEARGATVRFALSGPLPVEGGGDPPVEVVVLASALRLLSGVGGLRSTGHGALEVAVEGPLRLGDRSWDVDALLGAALA